MNNVLLLIHQIPEFTKDKKASKLIMACIPMPIMSNLGDYHVIANSIYNLDLIHAVKEYIMVICRNLSDCLTFWKSDVNDCVACST